MWLLPIFSTVSRAATRVYYRLSIVGADAVPHRGPVLLVANHPNSLLDPMLVVAAAHRPVRFLAKAPLFSDPLIGWAIRASGAIPVYRRQDDPDLTVQNVNMFEAVFDALATGAAIGIFPEGISHSEPSMAPLKTGAARIVLGARAHRGVAPTIIPIGVVLRNKETFRSRTHVVVGKPVEWTDLIDASDEDVEAVRSLTDRIEEGLRHVTVNLAAWEDRPLVECAEEIWVAEWSADRDPRERMERTNTITTILAAIREQPADPRRELARDVRAHERALHQLRLRPSDLRADVSLRASVRWMTRRFYLIGIPALLVSALGRLVFLVPYLATARLARIGRPLPDQIATHKLLYGMGAYALWLALLTAVAAAWKGPLVGGAVLVSAPVIALAGRWLRERWRGAGRDIRRFFLLRGRRETVADLRERQHALALRLRAAYEEWVAAMPSSA